MGDSFVTIIAIFLAAILMFVFPLMSISERTDDVSQLSVQTATTEFVDKVRVYQVQSGIEVRNAANIKELQLSDKGAYILNVVQKDGRVVNKRVIL